MSATPTTAPRIPGLVTLLRVEVADHLKGVYREPAALFFSIIMPVAFFALFTGLFGGEQADAVGRPVGTIMLATFGAYGAVVATMMTPGIGLAEDRERGWLRVLKTSPVPVPVSLAGRVIATVPYSLGILAVMTATAGALGYLSITPREWLLLVVALLIGSLPFALVGLAVGSLATGNATAAILNAVIIPMAIAGGMWMPLEILPDWMQTIAPALPTYHLSRLALAALGVGSWAGHVAYLLGATAVAGTCAVIAYRRSPT